MTTTGGDDINLAPENDHDNDDHDDGNVDLDGHDDGTGDTTAQAAIPTTAGGGNGPPISTSGLNRTRFWNSSVPKARTPFPHWISSDNWKISPKQIDGRMPRLITTLPTPSGTRHESGCHQSSTGTRTRTLGWSGQISRTCLNKNMQSKQMTN
jgi:hypothetical protein